MIYNLKHLDGNGILSVSQEKITYLEFIKHLAFAGMGTRISPSIIFKYLGYFFEFNQFWGRNSSAFSLPPITINDPTEINYISNRIGRALADHLSKKLYNAVYTHSYEDAMVRLGLPITGSRPDFYCDTLTQQFAVEAKGLSKSTVSENEMNIHKAQSQKGKIPVNFTIASVTYNIYQNLSVKYYDPINENVEYNRRINLQLRSLYYNSLIETLEMLNIKHVSDFDGDFLVYDLQFPFGPKNFQLLIHRAIAERDYMNNDWLFRLQAKSKIDNSFIDNDGIGLRIDMQ